MWRRTGVTPARRPPSRVIAYQGSLFARTCLVVTCPQFLVCRLYFGVVNDCHACGDCSHQPPKVLMYTVYYVVQYIVLTKHLHYLLSSHAWWPRRESANGKQASRSRVGRDCRAPASIALVAGRPPCRRRGQPLTAYPGRAKQMSRPTHLEPSRSWVHLPA